MTRERCSRCAILTLENQRLRTKIQGLLERIKRDKKLVQNVCLYAQEIEQAAAGQMAEKNLPRGRWSYLKGGKAVAYALKRKLLQVYQQL